MIKYSQPCISDEDIKMVSQIMACGDLTQSNVVSEFELAIKEYTESEFSFKSVSNATVALETVYRSLNIGYGSLVWTTPITFVATANAAKILGAEVDFVDIDADTYNICPNALEAKLLEASRHGSLPDLVVPVHLAGEPCNMKEIKRLASRFGFLVVEDASHAFGARFENKSIGTMQYSDAVVFSHHAIKNLTTGEGGSFSIKCPKAFQTAVSFTSHGVLRGENDYRKLNIPDFYYHQVQLGSNLRLTAMQAGLGLVQLKKFDQLQFRRAQIIEYYKKNIIAKSQKHVSANSSANHLYIIEFADRESRDHARLQLSEYGIESTIHYWPVHRQPYYYSCDREKLPNSENYGNIALSIPCHPALTDRELEYISDKVNSLCT